MSSWSVVVVSAKCSHQQLQLSEEKQKEIEQDLEAKEAAKTAANEAHNAAGTALTECHDTKNAEETAMQEDEEKATDAAGLVGDSADRYSFCNVQSSITYCPYIV